MKIKGFFCSFGLFVSLNFSSSVLAANNVNCVSQLSDLNFIMRSKEQGLLRFVKQHPERRFAYQDNPDFKTYLDFAYEHILQGNPRANMPCPVFSATYKQLVVQGSRAKKANIVDVIAPFELRQPNNDKVALLVHGLTDSPFTFHDLAQVYYQQGYSVRTILLPGHGTAPDALQTIDAKQWQQATDYAIKRAVSDYETVVLGGYSTGAALLINYLTTHTVDEKIKALMLFSPASEPHNKNGWLAKWIDLIPFVDWIDEDADVDFAKYESFPWNAAAAADDAMAMIELASIKKLNFPNIPIFSVLSDIDTTIDTQATLALLNTLHDKETRPKNALDTLVLYGDKKAIPNNFAEDYTVYNPQCASSNCENIRGISHIAVVNSPNNPHYGSKGTYRNCGSYLDNQTLYQQCKTTDKPNLGERTADNLAQYKPFQRLTYNPYFDELNQQIQQFLQSVEQQ